MVALQHFVFAGGLLAAVLLGCNREARNPGAQDGSQSGPSTDQRASIADLKRSLDEVDDRIKALEERAAGVGDKLKQEAKDEIQKLQVARDQLYTQLQALQTTGAEQWEDLKTKTASSVDSLGRAVAKTWKNVGADQQSATTEGSD